MSIFTSFRNKTAVTTFLVAGGLAKVGPTWLQPTTALHAQQAQRVNVAQINGVSPAVAICDNSTAVRSTAINIISTQTQVLATAGSSFIIYACGWSFTTPDSSVVIKFVEGTSTDCITGEATKASYNLSSKSGMVNASGGSVQFRTSSGASFCIDATSSGVTGLFTYVSSTQG